MFSIRRVNICFPLIALLVGCGGSGATGSASAPSPEGTITTLASSQSGGFDALFISSGTLYFADYNSGAIFRTSTDGGNVICLHWGTYGSPGHVISAAGKVFLLTTASGGGLGSIPDNVEGITPLGGTTGVKLDTTTYLDRVFWSQGSTVLSASATLKSVDTTSALFQGGQGAAVRIVIDGGVLYVSEAPGGRISRIDLDTGSVRTLVSSLGAGNGGIPLVATRNYLYALGDNRYVYRIDKNLGTVTLVASHYMYFDGIRSDTDGVYWWEHDAVNLVLRRYDDRSSRTENLVTIPMNSDYLAGDAFKYLCDGKHAYWITSTASIEVHRLSTTVPGSTPEQVAFLDPMPLPRQDLAPAFIAADDSDLYWTSRRTNALIRLPKSGGTPTVVTRYLQNGSIASQDNTIFVGDLESVLRIPKQGQPTPTSEWSQPWDASSMPIEAVFDGYTIFWAAQNFSTLGHPQTDFDLYSKASGGGLVRFLATLSGDVVRLFPFADNLFLVRDNSVAGGIPTGSVISTLSKSGGPELPLVQIQGAVPNDLVVRSDKIYVAMGGSIYVFDRIRGTFDLLISGQNVNRLYIDKNHLYWTEYRPGGGSVRRISLAGGLAETLYDGLPCFRITGDNQRIYWTAGWKLMSTGKQEGA